MNNVDALSEERHINKHTVFIDNLNILLYTPAVAQSYYSVIFLLWNNLRPLRSEI